MRSARRIYIEGYHQSEHDVALIWEDVSTLYSLVNLVNKSDFDGNIFEEALRRFNEIKNKK